MVRGILRADNLHAGDKLAGKGMMDTSYLLMALRFYRDRVGTSAPIGYQDALDWMIEHVDANYYEIEDILDNEREGLL